MSAAHTGSPNPSDPKPIFLEPDQGERLNVVGETVRVLADGAATHGRCFIFEEITPPNAGPPLHRHAIDSEFFYILEGTYKFVLDGKEHIARTGAFLCAPRGSLHTFCNIGATTGRMLLFCLPAGLEGPFRKCDQAAKSGPVTLDLLTRFFSEFNLSFEGPPLSAVR